MPTRTSCRAADGTLLFRHDQTGGRRVSVPRLRRRRGPPTCRCPGPAAARGFPHPTGDPRRLPAAAASAEPVTLENAPFSRNDPWLAPRRDDRTIGNNVEAFTNLLTPDDFGPADTDECNLALPVDGDLHACTTVAATFDYAYDLAQAPNASRRAGRRRRVTNLFYMNNYLHDWYYDAGFDEAAGNAQATITAAAASATTASSPRRRTTRASTTPT